MKKTTHEYKGVKFEDTQPAKVVKHCEPFIVTLYDEEDEAGRLRISYTTTGTGDGQ